MREQERCEKCGHKLKRCSVCKVVQTLDNSTITKGRFNSTCKACTAVRVLHIKYDKMSVYDLEILLKKHIDTAKQLEVYLSDRKRKENKDI